MTEVKQMTVDCYTLLKTPVYMADDMFLYPKQAITLKYMPMYKNTFLAVNKNDLYCPWR